MKKCNEIQQIIAALDSNQKIEEAAILKHIEKCPACQAYQQSYQAMQQAFTDMNDFDADDALFESTLSSIVNIQETQQKSKRLLNTQWASALAASFMLISLIALFPYNSISDFGLNTETSAVVDQISTKADKIQAKRKEQKLKESDFEFYDIEVAEEAVTKYRRAPSKDISVQNSIPAPPKMEINDYPASPLNNMPAASVSPVELDGQLSVELKKNLNSEIRKSISQSIRKTNRNGDDKVCCDDDQDKVELERVVTTGSRIRASDLEAPAPVYSIDRETTEKDGQENFNVAMGTASDKGSVFFNTQYTPVDKQNQPISNKSNSVYHISKEDLRVNSNRTNELKYQNKKTGLKSNDLLRKQKRAEFKDTSGLALAQTSEQEQPSKKAISPAQRYLNEINSLQNITYQEDTGYWANTYIPGDSQMRLLHMNLEQNNILGLENSISQNVQPFDYPNNSALAIYLNSDHAYVKGTQRMRLQVGIQATNRKGGHRTAMNIALVFDLTQKDTLYGKKMKALLTALLKAKQPGDNISLTIAGAAGGTLIAAEDFRQGSIQVALNQLFTESKENTSTTESLSLIQALQSAATLLQKQDDASASLGSSVIMLFTAAELDKVSEIENMAHNNALSGIIMSTISLSENNQGTLNKLALAGQGHALILASIADAKRVIDAELLASSRAVARALRLRIRLAKGVKLIQVLDSYNLNEQQAQRVREAEQSLDQRLSKNLGISADRGEDEEGIQIVIPSFFAGDTHVILLDVVVDKPGAVADVTLRYKDLLYLRNAITSKQLNIESKMKKLGPLQLNVMKNVLAHRFSIKIKQASTLIRQGNNNAALTELLKIQRLYESMRTTYPTWNDDAEILNDEKLLQQYIKLLNANTITDTKQLNYIADSMQYISWRKTITQTD